MITENQNNALKILGDSAKKHDFWLEYALYCFDRERGLRKQALSHLDRFIKSAQTWSWDQKIDFTLFLFSIFESLREADYGGFPQPLKEKLIKPILLEWCASEPKDSRPFRWYGKYYHSEEHLLSALEINPKDDTARKILLSWWMGHLDYSLHHLPDYYIGDPGDDLLLSEKIRKEIDALGDTESILAWKEELDENLGIIRNYMAWKESGHPDFGRWGEENGKRTGFGFIRSYYYEK